MSFLGFFMIIIPTDWDMTGVFFCIISDGDLNSSDRITSALANQSLGHSLLGSHLLPQTRLRPRHKNIQ